MTETIETESAAPDLSRVSTEELRRELADALGITARVLARLAFVWRELERRGEDLSALRGGLMSYLPQIAAGRLLPEVVVRCAGQAMVIRALSDMPTEEQRRILEDGVPVTEVIEGGEIRTVQVPPERLTTAMLRRAVVGDRLRPPSEQVALLAPKEARQTPTTRKRTIKVQLSEEEYQAIKRAAAKNGGRSPVWLREVALKAAGVERG